MAIVEKTKGDLSLIAVIADRAANGYNFIGPVTKMQANPVSLMLNRLAAGLLQ